MTASPGAIEDDLGERMLGLEVRSESGHASYRILTRVGEGAMSVAFYALRVDADGECPVVVKVVRPWLVRQWGKTAELLIQKEAIALGRLNERVPPTPFVVRFIDVGTVHVEGATPAALPYIVVEYVHGGAAGTTLTQRVRHAMRANGMAFGPSRAARLVEALTSGMVAVHDVGVIHRDLKPDNVLCCGTGPEEIFKIADFGVARPAGVAATFGGFVVGTMGYAAPELATNDTRSVGPWSDVFSLSAILYYALTGEDYFDVRTPADAIVAAVDPSRRSIREATALSPILRANPEACRAIDHALAIGTAGKTDARPHRADALATMIVPWLRAASPSGEPRKRTPIPLTSLDDPDEMTRLVKWSWTTLRRPGTFGKVIRNVAWDADGRCMAATSEGLAFWNGSTWSEVDHTGLPDPSGIRFVRRSGPGKWLVGGDQATFATYTTEGVRDVRRFAGWDVRFDLFSGELDDIAILVGAGADEPLSLCALSSRRWLKPLKVPALASVTSLTRIEDARWLVAGRGTDGRGYAGIYTPLDWEIARIDGGRARAFLATAGQFEHGVGLATGTGGSVLWTREGATIAERIEGEPDLSAAAVDASGRGWTAGAGKIWLHCLTQAGPDGLARGRWDAIWEDPSWEVPIVALFTDPGMVIAMTADGGIIEGRATDRTASTHPPPG